MGMMLVDDKTHSRLLRYKKNPLLREKHPKGKITHSMIIEAGLDALDESIKSTKRTGSVI